MAQVPAGYHRMPDGSLMRDDEMPESVGPPAPESRLEALKAHQAALESTPEPTASPSLVQALLPLVLAQGLDFLSTEKPLGFNKRDDISEINNRFPGARAAGFGGTLGRVGSNLSELMLAAVLAKKAPQLANLYIAPAAGVHADFAGKNWKIMREAELADRLKGSK